MRPLIVPNSLLVVVMALCIGLPSLANGQLSFDEPIPIAPNLFSVARPHVSDIDGDGTLDVILGSADKGRVIAFEINGDSLQNGRELIPGHINRGICRFADVNGDGFVDIITGNSEDQPASGRPVLFLNDGNGAFPNPIPFSAGSVLEDWQLETADLDGDQADEIIVIRGHGVSVYRYDSTTGTLETMASFYENVDWHGAAAADLNNDGINELLLSRWYWIGYWDPTSGGTSLTTIDEGTGRPWAFMPADVNGDGRMDLLTYFRNGSSASSMTPYMQQSGGVFTAGAPATFNDQLRDMKVFDADSDGFMEVWGALGAGIMRYELNTDGTIASTDTMMHDPFNVDRFLLQDIQADAIPDILTVTMDHRLVHWAGSPGPEFTVAPRVWYAWPHEFTTSPVVLRANDGSNQVCIVSGTSAPYYYQALASDMTILALDGVGLDPVNQMPLTPLRWSRWVDNRLLSADLDGDGDMDLVGTQNHAAGSSCIVYGLELDNASGEYNEHCLGGSLSQTIETTIVSLDILDVNGDGHADLVLKGYRTYPPQEPNPAWQEYFTCVLFRTGDWSFEEAASPLPAQYYLNHFDLDGDGDEDLVVTDGDPPQLTVMENMGSGQFQPGASVAFDEAYGAIVRYFDVDLNGSNELLLPVFADIDADGRIELLRALNTPDAYKLFAQSISPDAISEPVLLFEQQIGVNLGTYTIPSDLNLDGYIDLLVVDRPSFYEYTWSVIQGADNYPLSSVEEIYRGRTSFKPYLVDLDSDGDEDLIMHSGPCYYSMKNTSAHALVSTGSLSVYPNPSAGSFIVDLGYMAHDMYRIEVFDASGRMVASTIQSTSVFSMVLRGVDSGVYNVRATSMTQGDWIQQTRVIIVQE